MFQIKEWSINKACFYMNNKEVCDMYAIAITEELGSKPALFCSETD